MSEFDLSRFEVTVRRLLNKLPEWKGKPPTPENQLILQDLLLQSLCYLRGETEQVLTLGDLSEDDQKKVLDLLFNSLEDILHNQEAGD